MWGFCFPLSLICNLLFGFYLLSIPYPSLSHCIIPLILINYRYVPSFHVFSKNTFFVKCSKGDRGKHNVLFCLWSANWYRSKHMKLVNRNSARKFPSAHPQHSDWHMYSDVWFFSTVCICIMLTSIQNTESNTFIIFHKMKCYLRL